MALGFQPFWASRDPDLGLAQKEENGPILGGDFWPAHPFFPFAGHVLAGFEAQNQPFLAASGLGMAKLLASRGPFRQKPPTFHNTALFGVGGRQLLSPGRISGSIWMTFFISGTHDRPRDDI